jgi:hypothetical protein
MFQQLASQLAAGSWDASVQPLVNALQAALANKTIHITQPVTIVNQTAGPAFRVLQAAGDSRAIEVRMPNGQSTTMGVGLGNRGLVANEFVPVSEYALPLESVQAEYSQQGGRNGGGVAIAQYNGGQGFVSRNVPPNFGFGRGTGYEALPSSPGATQRSQLLSGSGLGGGGPEIQEAGGLEALDGARRGQSPPFGGLAGPITNIYVNDCGEYTVPFPGGEMGGCGGGSSGYTGTVQLVTNVTCSGSTLTVTKQSFVFENGLLKTVT